MGDRVEVCRKGGVEEQTELWLSICFTGVELVVWVVLANTEDNMLEHAASGSTRAGPLAYSFTNPPLLSPPRTVINRISQP